MNEDRRKAFTSRINQVLTDHQKRFGRFKKASHDDLYSRILSALEDAFQTGAKEFKDKYDQLLEDERGAGDLMPPWESFEDIMKNKQPFAPTGKDGPSLVLGAFTEEEIAKAADKVVAAEEAEFTAESSVTAELKRRGMCTVCGLHLAPDCKPLTPDRVAERYEPKEP